jgi:hypothetical protein
LFLKGPEDEAVEEDAKTVVVVVVTKSSARSTKSLVDDFQSIMIDF